MSPTAILIIQALVTHGPGLARQLLALFRMQRDPTPEEWETLIMLVEKPYADYIAEARARAAASIAAGET